MTDRITVLLRSGERFENLPAVVEGRSISVDTVPKLAITEGDRIERKLSNGVVERYVVVDATFSEAFMDMPPFYDLKVQKEIV